MSLPGIRRVPLTPAEWDRFHFKHFLDHKIILGVVATKSNSILHMPPIWPVPDNNFTARIAQFHQFLHEQMNTISGASSTDMSEASLKTPGEQKIFIDQNYREHLIFHQFVGVPA